MLQQCVVIKLLIISRIIFLLNLKFTFTHEKNYPKKRPDNFPVSFHAFFFYIVKYGVVPLSILAFHMSFQKNF
jgi:hypothetical protein